MTHTSIAEWYGGAHSFPVGGRNMWNGILTAGSQSGPQCNNRLYDIDTRQLDNNSQYN